MYVCALCACMVPSKVKKHQTPWNWSYRGLKITVWMWGTKSHNHKCSLPLSNLPSPVRYFNKVTRKETLIVK